MGLSDKEFFEDLQRVAKQMEFLAREEAQGCFSFGGKRDDDDEFADFLEFRGVGIDVFDELSDRKKKFYWGLYEASLLPALPNDEELPGKYDDGESPQDDELYLELEDI